jgi:hypothetical protein
VPCNMLQPEQVQGRQALVHCMVLHRSAAHSHTDTCICVHVLGLRCDIVNPKGTVALPLSVHVHVCTCACLYMCSTWSWTRS